MTSLTTNAKISYEAGVGTYTFSVYAKTLEVSLQPVWDAAGRTIASTTHTFKIEDTVQNDNGTNAQIDTIKNILTKPGGNFTYEDNGFGQSFAFNTASLDIQWGPKPRLLSLTHEGGGNAWKFTWQVEVNMLVCSDVQTRDALMEFNYTIAYNRDKSGYTSRTMSGFYKIPLGRAFPNDSNLQNTADAFLEKVIPPLLDCFRRTTVSRTIDASKGRCDFVVTDDEMPPNQPPPGVIDVQASHTVNSDSDSMMHTWHGTIEANYELEKGRPASIATTHFQKILNDRLNAAKQGGNTVIPTQASFAEPEIYGRSFVKCSLTYRYVANLQTVLGGGSGLWRPMPDSDWKQWSASLTEVLSPRGLAALRLQPGDDAVVDLCNNQGVKLPGGMPQSCAVAFTQGIKGQPPVKATPSGPFAFQPKGPKLPFWVPTLTPLTSWLRYFIFFKIKVQDEVVPLKPLPQQPLQQSGPRDNFVFDAVKGFIPQEPPPPAAPMMQRRAMPTVEVTLYGFAERAGYAIAQPALIAFAGLKPILANLPGNGFWTGITGNLGVPVVGAAWSVRYLLPQVPSKGAGPPANPWAAAQLGTRTTYDGIPRTVQTNADGN